MDKETEKSPPGVSSGMAAMGYQSFSRTPMQRARMGEGFPAYRNFRPKPQPSNLYGTHAGTYHSIVDVPADSRSLTLLKIEVIPELDRLDKLTKVESLYISLFDLSVGLPVAVGKLTTLKYLNLSMCELPDLPPQLSQLVHLQTLDVSHNNFSEFPPVICELKTLKTLKISLCRLRDLPPEFSNLKDLQELSLARNYFTTIPSPIYELRKLQTLDIRFNVFLKRIEEKILELPELSALECEGCEDLDFPPYYVVQRGMPEMKSYYKYMREKAAAAQKAAAEATSGKEG